MMNQKINIKSLSLNDLSEKLKEFGMEGYRATQVKQWLYQKQAASFAEMTNIAKECRVILEENFEIKRLPVVTSQLSEDGTRKYLLGLEDGKNIECVFIPAEGRNTLCVSSQVGCAMDCDFCLTATMGLFRNLSIYEIVDQVGAVIRDMKERGDDRRLSNLVFMGMGEPLANHKNLYAALEILLDQLCYNFSRNHITVSTSGLAPEIEKFGDKTGVKLAISLNATTDEVRDGIMPINKKYPLERLFEACRKMHLPNRNKITFEYVMLHGVNDTMEDAKRLIKILSTLKAKVNLIPFNEFSGSKYKRPPDEWVYSFQKILLDKGFIAVVRRSRGRDILGACGQLANASVKAA
ncbi:MAG TPA: 23S rRNA (adenine(2503)-C(2))-methyltransferase RlmN [Deltaproteobacteria bacterium]|nr:MAG: 23S rRNA (adenine(2503)-C(2))-methyltransferase [Deltaproteobacteria bacterium GWA2_45_12]HBF13918.1 23S rRNA (adenine(2503)-C(2))-methyltransferase RlmN [Deltaproteobacteria bacterium]